MRCNIHGELPPDWQSCPYCLRESISTGRGRGQRPPEPFMPPVGQPPLPPTAAVPQQAPPTRSNPYGGGLGAADATRNRPGGADVTHGAEVRGYGRAAANPPTRMLDLPESSRRRIRAWLIEKDG